jgi:hypothetical protein
VLLELVDDLLLVGGEGLELGAEGSQLGVRGAVAAADGHQLSILDVAPPCASVLGARRETPPPRSHHSRAAATAARPASFRRRA